MSKTLEYSGSQVNQYRSGIAGNAAAVSVLRCSSTKYQIEIDTLKVYLATDANVGDRFIRPHVEDKDSRVVSSLLSVAVTASHNHSASFARNISSRQMSSLGPAGVAESIDLYRCQPCGLAIR